MPRTVRELLADGSRNAAEYHKRLADERWNQAFQDARFAETWARAVREGWPFIFDHRNRRTWSRQPSTRPAAARDGEGES
jgi:hypothetical protein